MLVLLSFMHARKGALCYLHLERLDLQCFVDRLARYPNGDLNLCMISLGRRGHADGFFFGVDSKCLVQVVSFLEHKWEGTSMRRW